MSQDLIRLMRVLFAPGGEAGLEALWRPAADVFRTPDGWAVKFELAGVRAEDVELEVCGRRLGLRGVRRDCAPPGSRKVYQLEIAYSRFERVVELPVSLDRAEIETTLRDGMLLVHIRTERGER
jgi:HSP20 family protein